MRKGILHNQRGQSAVEFMVCVVVVFFFLLFYLALALLMVTSNYMDYATFMTARTYKAGHGNSNISRNHAIDDVFKAYMQFEPGFAKNVQVRSDPFFEIPGQGPQSTGLLVSYSLNFFFLPPLFISQRIPSLIPLNSEAHLGKEPSIDDCQHFFSQFLSNNGLDPQLAEEMEDNGC